MQSIHKSRKSIQINLINQYRLRIRLAHHSRDFGLVYKGLPFNRRSQRQAKSFNSRWQKKLLLCSSGACSSLCNIKWSATEKRGENLENFANQTKHFHTQMPFCPDIGKISVSNPSLILKIWVQTRPGKCVNATPCFVTENRNQHVLSVLHVYRIHAEWRLNRHSSHDFTLSTGNRDSNRDTHKKKTSKMVELTNRL